MKRVSMQRLFLYEHFSATSDGLGPDDLQVAGRAMREAVAGDLASAGGYRVSPALRVAPGESPAAFVARESSSHDLAWIIAPESGGVLACMHRAVGSLRWIGCDAAAISLAASKRATLAHFARLGLVTPLAFAASRSTRRWVVKPDDGAGARMTRVHPSLAGAREDLASRPEPSVLEPWVEGEALSLSLLCDGTGVQLLSVNRQVLAIDAAGWLSLCRVEIGGVRGPRRSDLFAWAQALCHALPGLRGFVGVDLAWHARCGPVLIEVNPRVTTAYVGLSDALGRNVAGAVLAAHSGALRVSA